MSLEYQLLLKSTP